MNPTIEPCYLCARFKRAADALPGYGYCHGREEPRRYDDDNAGCVLWNRARDEARRREWAGKQERMEKV